MRRLAAILLPLAFTASQAQAATTPGAISGSFGVSESGAFTYNIPIAVPPGTAGIEPKLSLAYNSQGGNGLLGMGWSLGGLSVIHRCAKTVAQDGILGSVNYNANDRYCLDGQRLVAINGAYGADNTEYRTESESYSRIVSYGSQGSGPTYWKVWTKSGQIIEYGNTADSRIEAQGKTEVMLWSLNKHSDTVGNYLTVSYIEDNPNGQYYQDRIDYTGNDNTGKASSNSVRFVYETRPDITPAYHAGSLSKITVRLTNVQSYAGDGLTRDYRLIFEQGTTAQRSRLNSLAECADVDGSCLRETNFSWESAANGFDTQTWSTSNVWSGSVPNWAGDFNGDGKTDLATPNGASVVVRLSTGAGFDTQTWATSNVWSGSVPNWAGDFNGDGKTDLATPNGASVVVRLSTGVGFDTRTWATSNVWSSSALNWVGDFNGEGKTDLAMRDGENIVVRLSTGTGFDTQTWTTTSNGWSGPGLNWDGDFNGDGKTDLASANGASVVLRLSMSNSMPLDLLRVLTTGLGAVKSITYKPLTDGTVYTKATTAVYPYVDVQAPLYVVSSVSTSDGAGGNHLTNYTYAGAKSRHQGGGFLGFRQVTANDPQAHIRSTTTYRQDYPYHGQPLSSQKLTDNNVLLNQSTITYTDQLLNPTLGPVWHQSMPTHTVESSYELSGSLISTVITDTQYDAYGNPTSIVVNSGGGYSKTTTNTYDNIIDDNRWFLGRLRRSTVNSVTP